MAASFINTARFVSAVSQSSYSPSYNLQTASGNDRLVVVHVGYEDDTSAFDVSSVTFDGVSPDGSQNAEAVGASFTATSWIGWWFESSLPATTGNKTIAITLTGAVLREIQVNVMEFTGVSNAAVTQRSYSTTRLDTGDLSTVVTVDQDDSLVVGAQCNGGTDLTGVPTNLTQAQEAAATSSSSSCGYNTNADTASITVGWTNLANRSAFGSAIFRPITGWTGGDVNTVPNANIGEVNTVEIANIEAVNTIT